MDEKPQRKCGWYWVHREGSFAPECGFWTGKRWVFCDVSNIFDDSVETKVLSGPMETPNG